MPGVGVVERDGADPEGADVGFTGPRGTTARTSRSTGGTSTRASHAWIRWRYHYPQAAYPYQQLVQVNGARGRHEAEFELLDTGVFDENRYFSVDVTYAKNTPTDVQARVVVHNHGPDQAELSVLPTVWFRNTWRITGGEPPMFFLDERGSDSGIAVTHPRLGGYRLEAASAAR